MQTKLGRYCEGLMEAIWLAVVIIIPLFFNIYSSRIFEPDKVAILRSLALFALGAWLIKIIEEGGVHFVLFKKKASWIKTLWNLPMLAPVMGLLIVYVIATVFSISPGVSLWGSYQRLQGTYTTISYLVFFAVIIANMRKWSQVERLITTIILTSLPVSLYGLLQRFGLDPIPWAGNTTTRIAANLGNSIFVAAYLAMVAPLTAGRLVRTFKKILAIETDRIASVIKASIYSFVIVMQFIAIYLSQSRGPVIGLLAGGFIMGLQLSFAAQKRWISYAIIGLAIIGGGFLLSINLENGPMRNLRNEASIGRFGMLLDPDSTTALTRKYIWKGTADLVGIHPPLKFPDGETDPFNLLRPLIGYGPESMYVAFNQYYPPELGQVEKRNASPDRSHNETWDAIVITGSLGLMVYLVIFGASFYYGVKWMGLINSKKDVNLFIGLMVIGGIGGSVGFSLWRGREYFGIGLPFGMVTGLVFYMLVSGLIRKRTTSQAHDLIPGGLINIMLLSALVAHFIEINFGIAVVATRMLFWIYVGLMIVVGYLIPVREQNKILRTDTDVVFKDISDIRQGKKKPFGRPRTAAQEGSYLPSRQTSSKRQMYIVGFIISLVLVTLSYDYIINPHQDTTISAILINSFTRLSKWDYKFSAGILGLWGITILLGVILFTSENELIHSMDDWWKAFVGAVGTALGIWLLFSIIYAGKLSTLAQIVPKNQYDVLAQVDEIGSLLSIYYVCIGIILCLIAFFMIDTMPSRLGASKSLGIVAAPVFLSLIVLLINVTNLRVINADIAFKTAEPFVSTNQWKMATLLYQQALQLAPMEDHYYLFLGRSYLEQAKSAQTVQEQDALILQAEDDLKIAQRINPLNTDHTANLARLYNWWASRATDSATLLERGQIANDYFATAVTLSPNNMTIRGEWAILNIQILQQPQIAFDLLSRAIEIDPNYSFTQGLMGDFYSTLADSTDDYAGKKAALEQAVNFYLEATRVHSRRDTTPISTYLLSLGSAYIELAGQEDESSSIAYNQLAIDALEAAMNSDLPEDDLWRVQELLAKVYAALGDNQSAITYAQVALAGAPDDALERIQTLIETIQGTP